MARNIRATDKSGVILYPATKSTLVGYTNDLDQTTTNVKKAIDEIISIIKADFSIGTDGAKSKFSTLQEGYQTLWDLANTVQTFLVDQNAVNTAIDTWKEIQNFLAGITDTDTLTNLLLDLKTEIETNVSNQISELSSSITNKITEINSNISEQETAIDNLKTSITSVTERVDTLEESAIYFEVISDIDD